MTVRPNWTEADADYLEAEYNARRAVPEFAAIVERWMVDSRIERDRGAHHPNLAYGPSERQALDLFLPEGPGPHPILAFIHGGYWQAMDRTVFSFIARGCRTRGIAYAAIGYDLCPSISIGGIIGQIRAALRFLHDEAGALSLDPARLGLTGHSAGGHLTAMMLAEADKDGPHAGAMGPDDAGGPVPPIAAAMSISGVFDLSPLRFTSINGALHLSSDLAWAWSPGMRSPRVPHETVELALAVGDLESESFKIQSNTLAERWRAAGAHVSEFPRAERDHFTILDDLANPEGPLLAWLAARLI
ncbi:MAG: alpha/beta hydrolase [Rhodospirillum sp.]|nr:alpha/beta hydrolase [Rhodospirillum sp.]MCF8488932.1 alpha/beta hydrolase [Rhodospirillum sp.]MCF8498988.1 alpha/beta hydrolase [Rhodospirillum sp.]